MAEFTKAFQELLSIEGGWSDLKSDPGGLTRFGISSRYHPEINLNTLTVQGAAEIYEREYWIPAGCDRIEDQELAEEVFKLAVNKDVPTAVRILQQSVNEYRAAEFLPGCLVPDGHFGELTKNSIASIPGHGWTFLCWRFELNAIKFYATRKGFNNFGRGWVNRVLES